MRLAIIPARGGSKRIEHKNIVDFCGKPLIAYTLETAKASGLFDEIHVSTDDLKIKEVVESLGFKVDFMRTPELSDDFTGVVPVLKWVVGEYEKLGKKISEIGLIMPTAPLINANDLKLAYESFIAFGKKHPTMSCGKFPVPVDWAFIETNQKTVVPLDSVKISKRSQDLPKYFFDTGAFSFLSIDHINNGFSTEFVPYYLPIERAVDIDELSDLNLAKILYLGQKQIQAEKF